MLLCIDIGNTNTVLATFDGEKLVHSWRVKTDARSTADEMGLMVWAEVPVYWTISWENPATLQNAQAQLTDLVVRDKNRASVVVWSVGNETPISAPRSGCRRG